MNVKKVFVVACIAVIIFSGCASFMNGLLSDPEYPPPAWISSHSIIKTDFWSVQLQKEELQKNIGIWEINYTLNVPEKQQEELPVYFPFKAGDSWADPDHYWMVHTNIIRRIADEAGVTISMKNTSDKSVSLEKMKIEIAPEARHYLTAGTGKGRPGTVNPGATVSFTLAAVAMDALNDAVLDTIPVTFRLIDIPVAVHNDGTLKEVTYHEDSFTIRRTAYAYESTITYGSIQKNTLIIPGEDGTAHMLDKDKTQYGTHYTTEFFTPVELTFKTTLDGPPAAAPNPVLWIMRPDPSQPHDFGQPEGSFSGGVPDTVIRH